MPSDLPINQDEDILENDDSSEENSKSDDKPTGFLCPECGRSSLVEGKCPNCGQEMLPDHKEIPGENKVEDDEAYDGMPEEKKEDTGTNPDDSAKPEKYSLEDLKEAEEAEEELMGDEE